MLTAATQTAESSDVATLWQNVRGYSVTLRDGTEYLAPLAGGLWRVNSDGSRKQLSGHLDWRASSRNALLRAARAANR